jgi:hypothetical protein
MLTTIRLTTGCLQQQDTNNNAGGTPIPAANIDEQKATSVEAPAAGQPEKAAQPPAEGTGKPSSNEQPAR